MSERMDAEGERPMKSSDRALCLDTLRTLSNPEGINQYSKGTRVTIESKATSGIIQESREGGMHRIAGAMSGRDFGWHHESDLRLEKAHSGQMKFKGPSKGKKVSSLIR